MHPTYDLLHHVPVRQGVRVLKRRPIVHRMLLLRSVQEQGTADDFLSHDNRPARALPA